jgi:hypothetical protein
MKYVLSNNTSRSSVICTEFIYGVLLRCSLFHFAEPEMLYAITASREPVTTAAISRREAKHMRAFQITEQMFLKYHKAR